MHADPNRSRAPAADELLALAQAGATGVLYFSRRSAGEGEDPVDAAAGPAERLVESADEGAVEGIALVAGRLTAAIAGPVPGPAEIACAAAGPVSPGVTGSAAEPRSGLAGGRAPPAPSAATRERILRESLLDAVSELLGRADARTAFAPRETLGAAQGWTTDPWRAAQRPEGRSGEGTMAGRWTDARRVVAEATRRRALLTTLAPVLGPETRLAKVVRIAPRQVTLSGLRWRFVAALGMAATPRSLAPVAGCGITEAVVCGYTLVRIGIARPETFSAGEGKAMERVAPFLRARYPENGGEVPGAHRGRPAARGHGIASR
ncbi:hypothetical protein ACL02T_02785 [Pseudonocardia sp. RS010]|uniref:hypothetical protein n=1 Tax=Pseudonocardia sp. RS010 TaxID=3385979 RepID=UPI0039A2D540